MRTHSVLLVLLLACAQSLAAQIPGLSKPADEAAAAPPQDPLGRTSPRATIVAFSRAVQREDYSSAAQYLQLEGSQKDNAQLLSVELKALFDRDLHESIGGISDAPDGALDDGLPAEEERVGPLVVQGEKVYIILLRVHDAESGLVWLISSETLRHIPAIASIKGQSWIERNMPASLVKRTLFDISLAHWLVLFGVLAATAAFLILLGNVVNFVARALIRDTARKQRWDEWYATTRWPAVAFLTILAQYFLIPPLGYPLTFRVSYARVGLIALVITLTWLLRRALRLVFTHASSLVWGKDRASTRSLMMLAQRMIQALLLIVAAVAVLILLGVETKTALAGLGVVGVALALGAQKTVENLLGGIFLLSDKALAVGDYCTIGNQSGWIEDVTMRSVRLRTVNQTLVSLPAGSLAQTGIENFATRRKMAAQTMLRLRYGTGVDQLRQILDGTRTLLEQNPKIEKSSAYVRLVNFGPDAIELELFAYVLTADADEFRVVREDFLLEIAALVEAAGSALAPTRFFQIEGPAPKAAS